MNENNGVTEISFSDIIKMFKGKGKKLLCIALVFFIISVAFTAINVKLNGHYGNTVEFHVSKSDKAENLIPFLRSEAFAEKLFLDDNGLPPEEQCNPEDYAVALEAVTAYNAALERVLEANRSLEDFTYNTKLPDGTSTTWSEISFEYSNLQKKCDDIIDMLKLYKSANADAVAQDPNHLKKTEEYEAMLDEAFAAKKDFEDKVYLPLLTEKELIEQTISAETYNLKLLRKEAERLTEIVVSPWRNSDSVKSNVSLAIRSLEISHDSRIESSENSDATSFVKISVSVAGNKEFAEYLIERIKVITPAYIERFIEKYSGSVTAKCTLITPYSQAAYTEKGIVADFVKNATIAVIFSLGFYCIYIVAKNYVKRAMEE